MVGMAAANPGKAALPGIGENTGGCSRVPIGTPWSHSPLRAQEVMPVSILQVVPTATPCSVHAVLA